MRIAIDATSVPPSPAGAGVYAIELVRALAAHDDRHDGYAVFTSGAWFDDVRARKNWRVEHVSAASPLMRLLWEQVSLPGTIGRLGADVSHSTHHTLPLRPMGARRVVTVHDLTFFRLPQRYPPVRRIYMQTLTRLAARVADAIIVPSYTVRDDVARMLGAHVAAKSTVVYEAAGATYRPVESQQAAAVARRHGIDGPYILSVGSLEPGKNRGRLIRALRQLRDAGVDATLVVVGQRAWSYEPDFALARELSMDDRIKWLGYVDHPDMPALYRGATLFAFPSLYEGFGLPVLEAMACGTPVLTSNVSATAEVAGEAAMLVDPRSVDAVRDGLRELLSDEVLRGQLSRRGIARAEMFSWARAAAETRAVYERCSGAARA